MLWRLAMCIARCWHTSSILSHVYTSLPYSRDSLQKTWTRFHHLFRKVHWVHILRFEVTQQVGVAKELTLLACFVCYNIRNYASIDVVRPLIDMQGSTKIASSDHQRRGRISWISLTLTVTLTLTLINWQSNSEVCTVGIGRTCYVPQACLCHRRLFLLPFVHPTHYEVAIFLSSILWRLSMCIPRCWHTSSILSHVYTSLLYSRDSLRKTWTRFHHLFRKFHRVHEIYISTFWGHTTRVGVTK